MMFIVLRTEMLCAWEEQILQHSFVTDNLSQIVNEKQISHFDSFRNSIQIKKIFMEHKPTKCTFQINTLIPFFDVFYMFQTSWVHPQEDLYAQCLYVMFYMHWCKDEPTRFKTGIRRQKLNRSINLKSVHFICLCFPMHGAKKMVVLLPSL
jgi:hypothetical protein